MKTKLMTSVAAIALAFLATLGVTNSASAAVSCSDLATLKASVIEVSDKLRTGTADAKKTRVEIKAILDRVNGIEPADRTSIEAVYSELEKSNAGVEPTLAAIGRVSRRILESGTGRCPA